MHKPKKLITAMTLALSANVSLAQFDAQMNLSDVDGNNGIVINGVESPDNSGGSVSYAGDVNGDGVDDVIIGARFAAPGGRTQAGRSFVVFGSSSGLSSPLELSNLDGSNGFAINGENNNDHSGMSVAYAGDINGDGFDDVVIGAYSATPNATNRAGKSYVIFGKDASQSPFSAAIELSALDGNNGFVINGEVTFDYAGYSVSTAGDINGDGIDDLIVSAAFAENNPDANFDSGQTYVIFGKNTAFAAELNLSDISGGDGSTGFVINGVSQYDAAGTSVSYAGDINDDGFDDIIIGADNSSPNGFNYAGTSYVVFGKDDSISPFSSSIELSALNGTDGFVIYGVNSNDKAGKSVSAAGDVNGDGIADIVIGASGADPVSNSSTGAAYVIYGKDTAFAPFFFLATIDSSTGTVLRGASVNDFTGWSVADAGDFNLDGTDDFIVGARGPNSFGGKTYVVYGNSGGLPSTIDFANLDGNDGFTINAASSGDFSGSSVSRAGDFNADGINDIIIGSAGTDPNGSSSGSSYILFGREKPIFKDGFE
ncbi:MAG: integrin alpha [Marinicella sp.]